VFIYIFYWEIIVIFILFLNMQGWADGRAMAQTRGCARRRASGNTGKEGATPSGGAGLRC